MWYNYWAQAFFKAQAYISQQGADYAKSDYLLIIIFVELVGCSGNKSKLP